MSERALLPHSRATATGAGTTGVAIPIPNGSTAPYFAPTVARIETTELSYIGWGEDDSPPTASATNTVYQQADVERDYVIPVGDSTIDFLYVYSRSATTDVFVSFFG